MDGKSLRKMQKWVADVCDELSSMVIEMEDLDFEECGDTELTLVHSETYKALTCALCASDLLYSKMAFGEEMAYVSIPIKLLSDDVEMPKYAYEGDAGLDLRSAQDLIIWPGKRELVKTGIAVAIPKGYAGFVQPRSGIAINKGITVLNSPGLIDSQYRGEVKVALINLGDERVTIHEGDRIAQLVIQPVAKADLLRVAELSETVRGAGGFGSSGVA